MKLRMKKCKCGKFIDTCCQECTDCSCSRAAAGSVKVGDEFSFYESGKLVTRRVVAVGKHALWYNGGATVGVSCRQVIWDNIESIKSQNTD